jgi:hypothetical protein
MSISKYTYEVLKNYCSEKNIILSKDYSQLPLKGKAIIEAKCKNETCNNNFSKLFSTLMMYENFYCKPCSGKVTYEKTKKTCLEKYGVENVFQSNSHKEKIKNTCLEKYGTDNIMKNKDVQEKIKKTCMEKYGVEHFVQSDNQKEKSKKTCVERYGSEYALSSKEVQNKRKDTCLQKYGVENVLQHVDIIEKIRTTCLEKYGVEHPLQNKEILSKVQETCMEKYGVKNTFQHEEFKTKIMDTNLQKYGVEHPAQNKDILHKMKQKCLEKYGVENVMYDPEISARSLHNMAKKKAYTFPSGKEVMVQGYEPFALDRLIQIEQIDETHIETQRENVPEIWYDDPSGNKHRHYVDIYIQSQNRCIEVKSTWTFQMEHCYIFEKQEAAKNLGYQYEIWVFSEKGELVTMYK